MTDTTKRPPKDPKPTTEGSGVCLTPEKADTTDPKPDAEKSAPK